MKTDQVLVAEQFSELQMTLFSTMSYTRDDKTS